MKRSQRKGRSINGILLLDKAKGLTSNAALQEVKRLFNAGKVGHTGSLDPLATGMLPLCFGEATKFSQFLLDANKRYLATFKMGVATDTGDADGKIIARHPIDDIDEAKVMALLPEFTGEIDQIPSMYSALKYKGKPLYKLARQGIEVERKARRINIMKMELIEYKEDRFVLDILCSKGTYIRSLAEDMGDKLGCGAHVSELRRLGSGPYAVEDCYTVGELESIKEQQGMSSLDGCLLPLATAVKDWPAVNLPEVSAFYLRQGQAVQISHAPTQGWVRIFGDPGEGQEEKNFIGVGEILGDGRIAPRRLVASK